MNLKLPISLISPDQLRAAALEVQRYGEMMAEAARRSSKSAAKGDDLPDLSLDLERMLPNPVTTEAIVEVVAWLNGLAESAKKVNITLPGVAPKAYREKVAGWFRQAIDPNILIVFDVNRALAGGFVLRFGGQFYDYSFRKRLLEKPERIGELLHNV